MLQKKILFCDTLYNMKKRIALLFIILSLCTLNAQNHRIISLSPEGTELLYELELDKFLIARTTFCNYPPETKNIATIGGFDGKTISSEKILIQKPTFVLLAKGMHQHFIPLLKKQNISYYEYNPHSIQEMFNDIQALGSIFNIEKKARELIEQLQLTINTQISKIQLLQKQQEKKYYLEIFYQPCISIGTNSFLNEIFSIIQGKNIFNDLSQAYPQVSEESIIIRNPEVIFLFSDSNISPEQIKTRKNWKNIQAIKNDSIFVLDANLFSRATPRTLRGIEILYQYLYSE